MIDGFSECGVYHAQFLGDGSRVRQEFAHPHASLVVLVLGKFVFTWAHRERLLAGSHAGNALAIAHFLGQILAVHRLHLGLVIPEVQMRGATAHEEINHPLGLGHMMHAALEVRAKGIGFHQAGHCRGAQSQCRFAE